MTRSVSPGIKKGLPGKDPRTWLAGTRTGRHAGRPVADLRLQPAGSATFRAELGELLSPFGRLYNRAELTDPSLLDLTSTPARLRPATVCSSPWLSTSSCLAPGG